MHQRARGGGLAWSSAFGKLHGSSGLGGSIEDGALALLMMTHLEMNHPALTRLLTWSATTWQADSGQKRVSEGPLSQACHDANSRYEGQA